MTMIATEREQFELRLKRLMRKHRAMASGYTTRMRPDGLIVAKPRKTSPRVTARTFWLFLAAFFLFKGFLLAHLGPQTYEDRVGLLKSGTVVEQAGAWVMQADPITEFVAAKIGPYLR